MAKLLRELGFGLVFASVCAGWGLAQPCPAGASLSNYFVEAVPPSFYSIVGSPTAVTVFGPGVDDTTSLPIPLPIPFSFFGGTKASFQVNANGFLAFDQTLPSGFFQNAPIPSVAAPNDLVAAWWDDLHTGATGSVLYDVTSDGELVVEWNSMEKFPFNASGENATFQIALLPSPANAIELYYERSTFASGPVAWSATMGVEGATGAVGLDPSGVGFAGPPIAAASNHGFPDLDFFLSPETYPPATYSVGPSAAAYVSIAGMPGEVVAWTSAPPGASECGVCGSVPDDVEVTHTMPFPFSYFLTSAASFTVDSNGFLSLNGGGCGGYVNAPPGSTGMRRKIAPFWDDLTHVAPTARTSHVVLGTPGSRQLVVQWEDLTPWTPSGGSPPCADPGNRVSFQAILHEGTNAIEFRYGASVAGLGIVSSTVAIAGPLGLAYDATGLGAANAAVPATGFLFDPCECEAMAEFGPSCEPRIGTAGGPPVSPNPAFQITETLAPPGSLTIFYLGLTNLYLYGTLPLPISISAFGYGPGCPILVDATVVLSGGTVGPSGTVVRPAPIPPGLASCAAPIYVQAFNIVPGGPGYPTEILSSNAGAIVF